ncbi:MAG: NAD(P)H-hydrate dehydratase [Spirochaetaceae bacterium]|nr:MAG: NAD(P)H-hydrate dehydratase [Spirochaetaceae bacterium]
MQQIDRAAQSDGIPGIALMEVAGARGWTAVSERIDAAASIVFLVGTGNNGGDALVMARYAAIEGYTTRVVAVARPDRLSPSAALQARVIASIDVPVIVWDDDPQRAESWIAESDVIVDGLAGVGISGPLREPASSIVRAATGAHAASPASRIRVAIDVPSGVSDTWREGDPAFCADLTLAMGYPKRSTYQPRARHLCGEIHAVALPFAPRLLLDAHLQGELVDADAYRLIVRAPLSDTYKYGRGAVDVYGGSRGRTGAAIMAAESALRSGAGIVRLYADESVYPILAASLVSVMVIPTDDAPSQSPDADAVVVGPGWGVDRARDARLVELADRYLRGVIDADALTVLARLGTKPRLSGWVLTPHPGELARLLSKSTDEVIGGFTDAALEAARVYDCVVVAKSHVTHIASPSGEYAIVDGMNAAMGTAGSGDVLAGIIGALLASGHAPWEAARAAVSLHQAAGRVLRGRSGLFLAEELPRVVAELIDGST